MLANNFHLENNVTKCFVYCLMISKTVPEFTLPLIWLLTVSKSYSSHHNLATILIPLERTIDFFEFYTLQYFRPFYLVS